MSSNLTPSAVRLFFETMSRKSLIMIGVVVGSFIGGLIPSLWGAGQISFSGVIFSAIGGIVGIWAGFKISNSLS